MRSCELVPMKKWHLHPILEVETKVMDYVLLGDLQAKLNCRVYSSTKPDARACPYPLKTNYQTRLRQQDYTSKVGSGGSFQIFNSVVSSSSTAGYSTE